MLTSMLTESTVTFIALGAIFAFSFYAVLNAGQLSLGQAGFASVAAYTSVLVAPDPEVVGERIETYVSMGITAENVSDQYKVSR